MQLKEYEDAKLLWKMFYAGQSFKHAQTTAEYIFNEKVDEDKPLYYPLITALYTLYGKPFKKGRPSKKSPWISPLEKEIIPYEYLKLHEELLDHRDQIYAHSDADAFEWLDVGQVNQVRLAVQHPKDKRLVCSQLQAKLALMPDIINLCQQLQNKIEKSKTELFKRYENFAPDEVGEYILNIDDQEGAFFKPAQSVIETKL
jgi:hypothetical protein